MKTFIKTIIAAVLVLFAGVSLAVDTTMTGVDNNYHEVGSNYREVGGGGWSEGNYDSYGGAGNDGTGTIQERAAMAESGGFSRQWTNFAADTCQAADDCAYNHAAAGGETESYQKSGSYILTYGDNASSGAGGTATTDQAAKAWSWRKQ